MQLIKKEKPLPKYQRYTLRALQELDAQIPQPYYQKDLIERVRQYAQDEGVKISSSVQSTISNAMVELEKKKYIKRIGLTCVLSDSRYFRNEVRNEIISKLRYFRDSCYEFSETVLVVPVSQEVQETGIDLFRRYFKEDLYDAVVTGPYVLLMFQRNERLVGNKDDVKRMVCEV